MLETVITELTRKQRPYYILQGSPIKGIDNQYWLLFKHRDADNFLQNIVSLIGVGLGLGNKHTYKLLRIDPQAAKIYTYTPNKQGNIPTAALLRTANIKILENFLHRESVAKEPTLLANSLRAIKGLKRRYNLPEEIEPYNEAIAQMLAKSVIYRRSTAYFDSGVLKLYEEPLQSIIQNEGKILLLMDWQGFTKKTDIHELEKLHDPDYLAQFAQRTLQEFLQGLADQVFSHTEILAELVRLNFLQIKLIKMQQGRAIYHKKTGIFSDSLDHHTLHEGSDNFTRAAHSRNAESVTFLYSWEALDREAIAQSLQQFDQEWQRQDITFDLSQDFLRQVREERDRRAKTQQPRIETISPEEFPTGETTPVAITGKNLDQIAHIDIQDDPLITVEIINQTPQKIEAQVAVDAQHPERLISNFRVRDHSGSEYNTNLVRSPQVKQPLEIPEYPEIPGFKQAVETILAGDHAKPEDFLYWMAKQRPQQFRVEKSDLLDRLVDQGILFEHQKSGAQHCLRVMQDFGVSVCADAVGLGKTRLAAAVGLLYLASQPRARIAIIAAKKLHSNWEREMSELGMQNHQEYELYNKNLMSRTGRSFLEDLNRYGGADLIIIDEAHEGIRNYNNRIHKTCLELREQDQKQGRQRDFLLLTATPWNNRREDIYNILRPFLSRLDNFQKLGLPPELADWFTNRDIGVERFTDGTDIFRRVYRELFLQRTRQMLRAALPDLNVYAKRQAEWLPVEFEPSTEAALEQIFTQFETNLFIPFADPIRYLNGSTEQRSLLKNQRRFFLQRAESSMYALRRTIVNFRGQIIKMQSRLQSISADAEGLKSFLLEHYRFPMDKAATPAEFNREDFWDVEDYEEDYEEEEEEETVVEKPEKRQQLRTSIDRATDALRTDPDQAQKIYDLMLDACDRDLGQLVEIQNLLAAEFVKDHKRAQVTQKVKQLVAQGHRVLLISTFSDTVLDYYLHMAREETIANAGLGLAIGSTKLYHPDNYPDNYPGNAQTPRQFSQHHTIKGKSAKSGLKRLELFRLFAPVATCRHPADRPPAREEIRVLIGSETLSIGQNLQDADYLINIDLPWNPMTLEQRIGRIDRPKQHHPEYIYIYYANSESQLLRQASRLANLNKKLVGDLAPLVGGMPTVTSVSTLGASVYGDTLFDDPVLPDYIEFIQSLVKARRNEPQHEPQGKPQSEYQSEYQTEQKSFQENAFAKQEISLNLYTQQEILYSEDLSSLIERLGEDYQTHLVGKIPQIVALGQNNIELPEPSSLVTLNIQYFDPNGKEITKCQELIFWNELTGERDAYGIAISTAFKTPEVSNIFPTTNLLIVANHLYSQLVKLKQEYITHLDLADRLEPISATSERLSKIQSKLNTLSSFPEGINRGIVKDTLKKLNSSKHDKNVQRLLRNYTDGSAAKLEIVDFMQQLVSDTDQLSLLIIDTVKPTQLKVSLAALLLRIKTL